MRFGSRGPSWPSIRHRSESSEKAWEIAVQGLGKAQRIISKRFACNQVSLCFWFSFLFFFLFFHTNGGSVDEWLESWTYNPEAPNSSPALADSWIGSR